jgi:hypothetical protein
MFFESTRGTSHLRYDTDNVLRKFYFTRQKKYIALPGFITHRVQADARADHAYSVTSVMAVYKLGVGQTSGNSTLKSFRAFCSIVVTQNYRRKWLHTHNLIDRSSESMIH